MDPIEAALAAAAGDAAPRASSPALANVPDLGGVADRIARVEGVGQNPRSTARGIGQFTAPTWIGTYRRHADASGMSDAQVLAMRDDPATARTMLDNLVQDNAQGLAARGQQPTPGNVYLAHGFGLGGANAILSADPSTPIERIVGADAMRANPQLAGMTAGQVASSFDQKMAGGAPSSGGQATAALQPDLSDPIEAALSAAANGSSTPPPPPGFTARDMARGFRVNADGSTDTPGVDGQTYVRTGPQQRGNGTGPTPPQESWAQWAGHNLNDAGVGLARGVTDVAGTIGAAIDAAGRATGGWNSNLRYHADATQRNLAAGQYDPEGWGSTIGRLGGDMFATAPLTEAQVAARLGLTGKLGALTRLGEMAFQGGAASGLGSGGHEFGSNVAVGAALGPAVGIAAEKVALPLALRAYAVSKGLATQAGDTRLARALRSLLPGTAPEVSGAGSAAGAVSGAPLPGWNADEIAQGWRQGASGPEWLPAKVPARGTDTSSIEPDGTLRVNIVGGVRPEWKAALDRMRTDQGGEAVGAINHPEIGPVDVPWGTDRYGLQHIEAKHPEVVDQLPDIVEGLPIKQYPHEVGNNRFVLENDTHRAVITPDMDGDPKRWLVTAH